jgi:Tol biopolymer transport system component
VLGCADTSGPEFVTLTVVTTTSGPAADADGYMLQIDTDRRERLKPTDTLLVPALVAGEHQLALEGVAPNCATSGGGARVVNTAAEGGTLVQFEVVCAATSGTLQLVTVTDGEDIDPNGFVARVGDFLEIPLGSTMVKSIGLPSGSFEITLGGIAGNCAIEGPNPRPFTLFGGAVARVAYTVHCSAAPPAGRGHEIAFVHGDDRELDRLFIMNEDGTGVRPLPGIPGSTLGNLEWLADGQRLAFVANDPFCECGKPYIFTLADGPAAAIPLRIDVGGLSWAPDGELAAFMVTCFPDCDETAPPTSIRVVTKDGALFASISSDIRGYTNPAWLRDGTGLVYVRSEPGLLDLARSAPDGSGETAIGPNLADDFDGLFDLAPSPDGSTLAFCAFSSDGFIQIYAMGMDGRGPVPLTHGPSDNDSPTWSPDGAHIAFVSNRDGNGEIYVMDATGSNPVRVTSSPGSDGAPAWRP